MKETAIVIFSVLILIYSIVEMGNAATYVDLYRKLVDAQYVGVVFPDRA